jgi:hypothetical protein
VRECVCVSACVCLRVCVCVRVCVFGCKKKLTIRLVVRVCDCVARALIADQPGSPLSVHVAMDSLLVVEDIGRGG